MGIEDDPVEVCARGRRTLASLHVWIDTAPALAEEKPELAPLVDAVHRFPDPPAASV